MPLRSLARRRSIGLAAVVAFALTACAVAPETATSREDAVKDDAKARLVRYHAFLRAGECKDVETTTGRWSASPLFHDAPDGLDNVRASACTFTWQAEATPDVTALWLLGVSHLTPASHLVATLEPQVTSAIEVPLPPEEPADPTPGPRPVNGSVGCDVCTVIDDRGHAIVILPSHDLNLFTLLAPRTDGKVVGLRIERPAVNSQVLSVKLPALEDGLAYKPGPARLLR